MDRTITTSLALVAAVFTGLSVAGERRHDSNDPHETGKTAHWGYTGKIGPEYWGELDKSFATCSSGRNQSPIDLGNMLEADLPALDINYTVGGTKVINNGHAIEIEYAPGSTLTAEGHTYELKQFHFHAPSENTIKGESFAMEAHYVHADADGNLAVIALMFKAGADNTELEKAWSYMPEYAEQSNELPDPLNGDILLPQNHDYYRYNGSLTTPPCTEGVTWIVMKDYQTASQDQIDRFVHVMHHDNNRPVQPINARLIIQ